MNLHCLFFTLTLETLQKNWSIITLETVAKRIKKLLLKNPEVHTNVSVKRHEIHVDEDPERVHVGL